MGLKPRSARRRLVCSLFAAVALGILLTLGLAWGRELYRAMFSRAVRGPQATRRSFMATAPDGREFEVMVLPRLFAGAECYVEPKDFNIGPHEVRTDYPPAGDLPWWVPWPQQSPGSGVVVVCAGFPFPALATVHHRTHTADWTVTPAQLRVQDTINHRWKVTFGKAQAQTAYLPTGILWRGMTANVLLLATLAWMALFGVRHLRAGWRARAGRCMHCGYDLHALSPGTPCPECGPAVPPSSPVRHS